MSSARLRTLFVGTAVVLGAIGFRAKVGGPLVLATNTLGPSRTAGDWVWVWKWRGEVRPGDPVWVAWPGTTLTGAYRVAAVGPASVRVEGDGLVVVDEQPIPRRDDGGVWIERWGDRDVPIIPGGPPQASISVPDGSLFVLSDARPIGGDSRVHGTIPARAVLGRIALDGWF